MITPDRLDEIVEGTQRAVTYMQTAILKRICDRIRASFIKKQNRIIIPSTLNEMHQLMDSGMMVEEIQREVERALPDIRGEVKDAFLQSAQEISDYHTDIATDIVHTLDRNGEPIDIEIPQYEKIGLPKSAKQLNMTAAEIRQLENMYRKTDRIVQNMCRTLPAAGNEMYVELCDRAYLENKAGIPIGDAIVNAINEASQRGIKVVNYDSGREDKVEVAIARAVRTAVNKANGEIVLTRCAEMGIGYVHVSEHMGARVTKLSDYTNHSLWQGKVYELDWKNPALKEFNVDVPKEEKGFTWIRRMKKFIQGKLEKNKYPDFVETCGYGKMLGICGINCRHTFSAFMPDVMTDEGSQIDKEANERHFRMVQKQRSMERAIRKTKTEINDLDGDFDEASYEEKERLQNVLEQQMDRYVDYCKDHNLKIDNWRLKISERDEPLASVRNGEIVNAVKKEYNTVGGKKLNPRVDDEIRSSELFKKINSKEDAEKYFKENGVVNSNLDKMNTESMKYVVSAFERIKKDFEIDIRHVNSGLRQNYGEYEPINRGIRLNEYMLNKNYNDAFSTMIHEYTHGIICQMTNGIDYQNEAAEIVKLSKKMVGIRGKKLDEMIYNTVGYGNLSKLKDYEEIICNSFEREYMGFGNDFTKCIWKVIKERRK